MLALDAFLCGALMICSTWLCVATHVQHQQQASPAPDSPLTADHDRGSATEAVDDLQFSNLNPPCFVDDVFAALHESFGNDGQLTNHSLAMFGLCTVPGLTSGSLLVELAKETSRNQKFGLELLHPAAVHVTEETGTIELTFDLPQSPMLERNSVLLLALKNPPKGENLDATFSSQSLQPNTQSVCVSEETRYILLIGHGSVLQKWSICADAKSPHMKQSLRDILIGVKSGSNIGGALLLLFSGDSSADIRFVRGTLPASSQTSSFLCELRRFLGDVMPQDPPDSTPLQLSSLQSLPPVIISPSTSEALLEGLINSSTLTVFSFTGCCSSSQVHSGELALSAALLEELRQRLTSAVAQTMEVTRQEEVGPRAVERLGRLVELSTFLQKGSATGGSQYCAFLLLKALQTVARTYEVKRGLRAARAGSDSPARGDQCGLRSLTVSLERHVIGPNSANINNCHGSCSFPLANPTNHAIMLNSHIEREGAVSQGVTERHPCCVPVAYEDMAMVLLDAHGTGTELKALKNVVATECGCR